MNETPTNELYMKEREEELDALAVECPQCEAKIGFVCYWSADLKHMIPNSHWARRSMAEYGELGIE